MNLAHALNVKSDFSIGQSLLQIDHIIEEAKKHGYESVTLMDDMTLNGMVSFTNKAKKAGIKPIIGCRLRVYQDPTYRKPTKASGLEEKPNPFYMLKVYVQNEDGIKSLLKLLSKANSPEYFYYHARCGLEDVMALEGVMIGTGDLFNVFHMANHQDIIDTLASKFQVFVELVPINTPLFDTLNAKALTSLALGRASVAPLVTYPTLYRKGDDSGSLEVLNCITSNVQMNVPYRPKQFVKDFHFAPPVRIVEKVKGAARRIAEYNRIVSANAWANGLKNQQALADVCAYHFEKQGVCLPKMADNEFMALGNKCIEGWKRRFTTPVLGYLPAPELIPAYKERLNYELGVLKKLGFAGYFLLTEDLVMWAKKNGVIVGPGRGSCFLPGHRVICDKSGLTKAIEDFSIGDTVLAHDGSTQEVIATLEFDRDEDIIELEFSNGVKIECTKDHKFFTRNRGWVVAEDLNSEDEFDDVSELARRFESETPPSAG